MIEKIKKLEAERDYWKSQADCVTVGVAVIVRRMNLLLVQRRTTTLFNGCWGLPGGHLEKHETIEQAARRELREEAGGYLRITPPMLWATSLCSDRDDNYHGVCFFTIADYIDGETYLAEPDKADQIQWCEWDEVPQPRMLGLQLLYDKGLNPWNPGQLLPCQLFNQVLVNQLPRVTESRTISELWKGFR